MKLNLKHYGIQKQLSMDKINTIVVESPSTYRNLCGEIKNACLTNDESLIFEDDEKILGNNKEIEVIESLYALDFGNKRIMKTIVERMANMSMNDQFYMETQSTLAMIENLLEAFAYELPCDIHRESLDIATLIKAVVKGIETPVDYVEQLDEYIKVMSRLLHIKIIVMFGLAKMFTSDEWRMIHKDAEYEGIYVLLIEQETYFDGFEDCNQVLIDNDDCWVV